MTKKDQTKTAIISSLKETNRQALTVKDFQEIIPAVSVDTIRAALKDLLAEKKVDHIKVKKGPVSYFLPEVKSSKKEKKDKAPTKSDLVRAIFEKTDFATVEEIATIIGSDLKNTRTLVSILANPSRTKNPLPVEYDRENKTFKKV